MNADDANKAMLRLVRLVADALAEAGLGDPAILVAVFDGDDVHLAGNGKARFVLQSHAAGLGNPASWSPESN